MAPAIAWELWYHWYPVAPAALILRVTLEPAATVCVRGSTEIVGAPVQPVPNETCHPREAPLMRPMPANAVPSAATSPTSSVHPVVVTPRDWRYVSIATGTPAFHTQHRTLETASSVYPTMREPSEFTDPATPWTAPAGRGS